ncbi:TRAP transporter large permease [Bacillus taeanensis]|uniref:TRAP transporter large permease n=1 Tax=Bacillus taeanensis TaxID=273032 RepID=A0A366XWE2_9BACI|nr:TRAP transporter large permease [Bacillus taeanensis]RBW68463.1 TRAP transporter large permease [Bacillus taeanensis]
MTGLLLVGLFLFLLIVGVPIAFVLGIVAYAGIFMIGDIPLATVVQKMFSGLNSFVLLAVPLFILAANLMNQGNISQQLIKFSTSLVGHIRGGLAHANIVVSMFFAGISGSSTADTAGVGKILIPSMIKEKYSKETAVAVTAASSTMGMIIPPSIPMVIYGSLASVSVGKLFIGGIIPGLSIGIGMMIIIWFVAKKNNYPVHERVGVKTILVEAVKNIPPLLTPIIIIGGIVGGIVTPTEAAVLACVYAFILGFFVYRTIKIKDLPEILMDTLKLSSLSLFALATASALGELISYYNLSSLIAQFFETSFPYPWLFLVAVILLFLFIGTFMDTVPAIILFVPIILPTATALGIDLVHLGLIIMICLAVGLITPPYGLCLLLASSIGMLSVGKSFRAVTPYLTVVLVVICLVAFAPQYALWITDFLE